MVPMDEQVLQVHWSLAQHARLLSLKGSRADRHVSNNTRYDHQEALLMQCWLNMKKHKQSDYSEVSEHKYSVISTLCT